MLAAWWWRRPRDSLQDRAAVASLGLVVLLFVSPFCALGSALFTARVVHHVILAAVLAPAVVLALRLHRSPVPIATATAIHALTFWAWHSPGLYALALSSDGTFWLMQLTIGGTAVAFWAAVFRAPAPAAVAALLATMVQMGALGALITFAGQALYAPHWSTTGAWGLAPLQDQQLSGLVMWAPAAAIYLLAALAILHRALRAPVAQ